MTQFAVPGPFDERHLDAELGTDPMRTQTRQADRFRERRRGDLEPIEPGAHVDQLFVVVSRCRPCRRTADHRRCRWPTSSAPRPTRAPCGSVKPPIRNVVRELALHLQPVRRAAVFVGRRAALGDDALPAFAAGHASRVLHHDQGDVLERHRQRQRGEQRPAFVERSRSGRRRRATARRRRDSAAACDQVISPSRIASVTGSCGNGRGNRRQMLRQPIPGKQLHVGAALEASSRIPSNLRSNTQSGPANRSCVSVAAMGTIQSGIEVMSGHGRCRLAFPATSAAVPDRGTVPVLLLTSCGKSARQTRILPLHLLRGRTDGGSDGMKRMALGSSPGPRGPFDRVCDLVGHCRRCEDRAGHHRVGNLRAAGGLPEARAEPGARPDGCAGRDRARASASPRARPAWTTPGGTRCSSTTS